MTSITETNPALIEDVARESLQSLITCAWNWAERKDMPAMFELARVLEGHRENPMFSSNQAVSRIYGEPGALQNTGEIGRASCRERVL